MSTQPFFIGRMTDPVVAHVLHLSALDFQVTKFLRDQIKNHTLSENDSVVLIADAHLNAKPSALRLLRRGITSTNIKIAGVFGDHGQIWAQYMDIPYLTEKPRMSMNTEALELRRGVLQNALINEQQNELNVVCNIVNNAIDQVDKVQELHNQRSELISFEQRQQQQREATVAETKCDPSAKSLDDLRFALEQRKSAKDSISTNETLDVVNTATETMQQNVQSATTAKANIQPLENELDVLLNTPTFVAPQVPERPSVEATAEPTPVELPVVVNEHEMASSDLEQIDGFEEVSLSQDEKRLAEEEDRNFELRKQERYVIQSSLKVEAPCQSSLAQESPARTNMVEGRIAVKPLRVRGRIRSGQTLHHGGDVIVEGSVHPSGEVAASGDIHVYGTGGGRLFAGIDGNINACIYIAVFDAEIVSIAGHYYVIEDSYNNWSGRSIKISLEDGILNFEEIRLNPQRAA